MIVGITQRSNLVDLGMGHFNATMTIPYMMISPATTDPKSGQVILLIQHIQRALYAMGATDVPDSGRLDPATVTALQQVTGPNWERQPWAATVSMVVDAKKRGQVLTPSGGSPLDVPDDGQPLAVGGPLDFLPDVPGGLATYLVGGYLLYRYLKRRHG
jgi:hypothetical protein